MNLVPEVVGRTVARSSLLLQKSSPQMLFGAGVAGVVVGTVLACRATLKVSDVLEESKEEQNDVRNTSPNPRRDISAIHVKTTLKVVRLYAPAIIVGGASVAALTYSHRILTNRNMALTSAYMLLDKGFNDYRARVVETLGEEQDRNFRYGTQQVQIEDPKNPDKKKKVTRVGINGESVYAKFFDESNTNWQREPEYNVFFIKAQQNYLNDRLRTHGYVFLNEAYELLGLPRTRAGSVVGWVLSPNGDTDNYIDFGAFDGNSERVRDFVNGYENSILLDFNVDGVIYDKLND